MKQFIKNTFTPGQAGKITWLLCLLFMIVATTGNSLHAQTLVVVGGANAKTYTSADIASWVHTAIPVNLREATEITASGNWTATQMGGLRCALRNTKSGTGASTVNLEKANLSAVSLTGSGWEVDTKSTPSGFSYLFYGMKKLSSVILPTNNNNTYISFNGTFIGCSALSGEIDLSGFANISSFQETFYNCSVLTSVKMPTGNNTNSVSFNTAFISCSALSGEIDLSGFSNISSFKQAFSHCSKLTSVKMPTGNSASVSFSFAFASCSELSGEINLSGFTNVSDFGNTFSSCSKLTSVKMPTNNNNTPISFSGTFTGCSALSGEINLSGFTNVSDFIQTFYNCSELTSVKMPTAINTTSVLFSNAFNGCSKLSGEINLSGFTNVSNFTNTFHTCRLLTSVRIGNIPSEIATTFAAANPNMLKYLPAGSTIPTDWSGYNNFINGTSDAPTAYGNIVLVDKNGTNSAPYSCPVAFIIPAGSTISYTRNFTGKLWNGTSPAGRQSIILPFDATGIEGKTAGTSVDGICDSDYMIYGYTGNSGSNISLAPVTQMAANTPYMVLLKGSSFDASEAQSVRFVSASTGITVPVTPATDAGLSVTNGSFTYTGTLTGTAGEAYYLKNQASGDRFVQQTLAGAVGSESQPFRARFTPINGSYSALSIDTDLPECPATWKGAGTGSDTTTENLWSFDANWTAGAVPADGAEIIYHADAIDLHVDGIHTAASISNATTASLVVLPGASLTITDWAGTTGIDGNILIKAEEGDKANGTFLVPAGSTVNAAVEFQTRAISTDVSLVSKMAWQFFGIPVTSYGAKNLHGAYIREFSHTETTGDDTEGYVHTYWNWLTNASTIQAFGGYEISVGPSHTGKFTFGGQLLTADKEHTVEYSDKDYFSGQWVLSNSFTAGVKVSDIDFESGKFEESVWLFNTGSSADWKDAGAPAVDASAPGQYTVIPANTGDVIPSMQGFVVKLSGTADGIITLPYPAAAATMPTMRSQQRQRGAQPAQESQTTAHKKIYTDIALLSGDGILKDRMQLYTDPRTTRGYDNGWDGRKMFGAANLAALFSPEPDGNYQVNARPDVDNTYLSMKAETGTRDYALRFVHHNTADTYTELWLRDLELGIDVDITADSSVYHFTAANEKAVTRRFRITSTRSDGDEGAATGIEVYRNSTTDFLVRNHYTTAVVLHIYSASGHLLASREVPPLSDTSLPGSDFPQGVYLVEGRTESGARSVVKMVSQ